MAKLNILLVCGGGASTGFVAQAIRKEAAKQGIDLDVTARSETEVDEYIDGVQCVMLGPHLSYLLDDLKDRYSGKDVKIAVMEKKYYAGLDGAAAIKHIQSVMQE